jgi:hypothetical protein
MNSQIDDTNVLLFDNPIKEEIQSAKEGSDIHGLLKKIAGHFHLSFPLASRESNWFAAQRDLAKWARFNYGSSNEGISKNIHDLLNTYAHNQYKQECNRRGSQQNGVHYTNPSSFDSWMSAQDQLAQQVLNQA